MSVDERFNKACQGVKNLKKRPTDQELLDLYGLYKQSTEGNCNKDQPGGVDLKAKAKWSAWNGRADMSQDAAKEAYVTLATELIAKYGE